MAFFLANRLHRSYILFYSGESHTLVNAASFIGGQLAEAAKTEVLLA